MAYEIALEMPGLDKVMSGFEKIIDKQKELNDKAKELEQLVPKGRGGGGGGGGRGGGILGGGGGWSDPWERLDRLTLQKSLGQMEGMSDGDMKGLNLAINRAQRAADKGDKDLNKQPKTQSELVMDALMTSRIGMSGGKLQVMPLMNRMAAAGLIDPSKFMSQIMNMGNMSSLVPLITKLALPAAAAVAAGSYVLKVGLDSMRSGAGAYWTGGGTPGQTGQIAALGSFIGLTAEQSAQRAVELGDRLKAGGYGAAYMRSKGIMDQGPWTVNKADNYLRVVDELRNIQSESKAIRVARDLGMTEELRFRDLSERTYGRLKQSMGRQGLPEERASAAEFDANWTMAKNWFASQARWLSTGPTRGFNGVVSGDALFDWGAVKDAWASIPFTPQWLIGEVSGSRSGSGSQGASAANENTNAVKDLTRTMKDHAEMLGGGPRGKGALPAAWRTQQLENAMQSDAIALGAFSI